MRFLLWACLLSFLLPIIAVARFFLDSDAKDELVSGVGAVMWLYPLTIGVWRAAVIGLAGAALFYISRVLVALWWWSPARVFISYHHSTIEQLQRLIGALNGSGVVACRFVTVSDRLEHDVLLDTVQDEIRAADFVIAIPGPGSAFVEKELFAATTLQKPLLILLGDAAISTPNSSQSSFPILLSTQLEAKSFAPLIRLLRNLSGHPTSVALLSPSERDWVGFASFVPVMVLMPWILLHSVIDEFLLPLFGTLGAWWLVGAARAILSISGVTLVPLVTGLSVLGAVVGYFTQLRRRASSLRALRRYVRGVAPSYEQVTQLLKALDPSLSDCMRPAALPPQHEVQAS